MTSITNEPVYSSRSRGLGRHWSKDARYRIYADRIELDFRFVVHRTFSILPGEILDIWIGAPPAVGELWRGRHAIAGGLRALKFDWADLYDHVVILRDTGWSRALHFTPEDPRVFVETAQETLCG